MWTSASKKAWSARFTIAAMTTISSLSLGSIHSEKKPQATMVCDPANRVTIYVWKPSLIKKSIGHAVVKTYRGGEEGQGIYASYWPANAVDVFGKRTRHSKSLDDDIKEERGEPFAVTLYSLDVDKINAEYLKFEKHADNWNVLGSAIFFKNEKTKNCAGLSHDLLLAGGLKDLLLTNNSAVNRMMGPKVIWGTIVVGALFVGSWYYPDLLAEAVKKGAALSKEMSDSTPSNDYLKPIWNGSKKVVKIVMERSKEMVGGVIVEQTFLPLKAILHGIVTTPSEVLLLATMAKDAEVVKGFIEQPERMKTVTPILNSLTAVPIRGKEDASQPARE